MVTARGFWPGLCVSLKHNSKFASFTLIAKGDYPNELNIPLPFSLISNDESQNALVVMPAYWFMYNLYALARNSAKYVDRDKRIEKIQYIEYDYLAPDSVNEIFTALDMLARFTAMAHQPEMVNTASEDELVAYGKNILEDKTIELNGLDIRALGFENSRRPVKLLKVREAYEIYKNLITYYGTNQLLSKMEHMETPGLDALKPSLPKKPVREQWINIGGQLLRAEAVKEILQFVRSEKINGWDDVHAYYEEEGRQYENQKFQHAYASLLEVHSINCLETEKME